MSATALHRAPLYSGNLNGRDIEISPISTRLSAVLALYRIALNRVHQAQEKTRI